MEIEGGLLSFLRTSIVGTVRESYINDSALKSEELESLLCGVCM